MSGFFNLTLSLMRDQNLHLIKFNVSANVINYLRSFLAFFIVFSNIMISAFDPTAFTAFTTIDVGASIDIQ